MIEEKERRCKKREYLTHFELYRILKNSIIKGITAHNYGFVEIWPEFPVDGERADLIITARFSKGRISPFLVIETKQRILTAYAGTSFALKSKKTRKYAEKLGVHYFGVCDGWLFLLFKNISLIGAYEVEMSEEFAQTLLMGIAEHSYTSRKETLNSLPKISKPNLRILEEVILPPIKKYFEVEKSE